MAPAYRIAILFMAISAHLAAGENHYLRLSVGNMPQVPVVLELISGDRHMAVDTVQSNPDGTIVFEMEKPYAPGMYSVSVQEMPIWEFIYNYETIEARLSLGAPFESVQIIKSDENTVYYNFIRQQNLLITKADAVLQVIDQYPASEDFYAQAVVEYGALQNQFDSIYASSVANKKMLASRFIAASREQLMPLAVPQTERERYMQVHYWDFVPVDTVLKYSPIITHKALKYYSLFVKKGAGQAQTQRAYMQATDTILDKFASSPALYDFIANYLMDGFEGIGQEEVADFIAGRYAELNSCEGKPSMSTLETKVFNRTKLKIGTESPAFSLENGKHAYQYTDQRTVLIFWATWCHHCTESMQQLPLLLPAKDYPNVDVVTVSLDKDVEDWKTFVLENGLTSYQNFMPGGWDAKIVKDFAVYGTPTVYILDKGKIVGKPIMFEQIPVLLDRL